MWPGFGENARLLAWIFGRCDGDGGAVETPVGLVPTPGAIDTAGIEADMAALLAVDEDALRAELPQVREHLAQFGDRLPPEVRDRFQRLESALEA
jgi:phosphoenolpyruvate carboxykinase (GTP)